MVMERVPPTVLLMSTALILELVVGIPLGILAAIRRNRLSDYVISAAGISMVAIPSFFLGLTAIYIFSVGFGVLPAAGMITPGTNGGLLDVLRHLVLPATVLALAGLGPVIRYVRNGLLETFGREYLVTARAKGLSYTKVVVRHAFPNAVLPLITFVGLQVGGLLAGAFVIEQIFSWPGLGKLALDAISAQDYPVIQAFAIISAALVLIGNLLADLAYGIADPRIAASHQ
jgi:peptide/nickel transport system permease protein